MFYTGLLGGRFSPNLPPPEISAVTHIICIEPCLLSLLPSSQVNSQSHWYRVAKSCNAPKGGSIGGTGVPEKPVYLLNTWSPVALIL